MGKLCHTTLVLFAIAGRAASGQVIRINAGGYGFTDPSGNVWEGDDDHNYYNIGTAYGACPLTIANTANPNIYCSNRWFVQTRAYNYEVPVPNGEYQVRLHFAEMYVCQPNN